MKKQASHRILTTCIALLLSSQIPAFPESFTELDVNGNATIGGSLDVNGATTLHNVLDVAGSEFYFGRATTQIGESQALTLSYGEDPALPTSVLRFFLAKPTIALQWEKADLNGTSFPQMTLDVSNDLLLYPSNSNTPTIALNPNSNGSITINGSNVLTESRFASSANGYNGICNITAGSPLTIPALNIQGGALKINGVEILSRSSPDGIALAGAGNPGSQGAGNFFAGTGAGLSNSQGGGNNFLGANAGRNNDLGSCNNFVGGNAGYSNTTGYCNNFISVNSGVFNTTGAFNNFMGAGSGYYNTTGTYNNFIGRQAGENNTSGIANTFMGVFAGRGNTVGSENQFIGDSTGYRNTSGYSNVFIGAVTGAENTEGSHNIFIGSAAGIGNTTGNFNTAIGYTAGLHNLLGSFNIFLGAYSDDSITASSSNQLIVGGDNLAGNGFIANGYFGNGKASANPIGFTLHATGASAETVAGADLSIAGGDGFGNGQGGAVLIKTAGTGNGANPVPSVERVRITPAGDVGIGIAQPLAQLHVAGTARFDGPVHIEPQGDLSMGAFGPNPVP